MCESKCEGPGALEDQFTVLVKYTVPEKQVVCEVTMENVDLHVVKSVNHPMWSLTTQMLNSKLAQELGS